MSNGMKLTKIAGAEKTSKQAWNLRESTVNNLAHYQEMYKKETGNVVSLKDVAEQMLNDFMKEDKHFQAFLRQQTEAKA